MSTNAAGTGKTVNVRLEAAETNWEIAPGHVVPGYGFNGQVPGPTIEADAGDTLVVELANALPEPTSIHWHGLRVPADVDGTELVQQPIQPGETFQYRFVLPDAGTFWYHPHMNETVQLEKGLSIGSRPFTILGTDGGLIPGPVTAAQVLLAPADRVELAVGTFSEGETLGLESLPYDRGMVKEHGGRYATVRVGSPAPSRAQIPTTLRTIEPLVTGDVTPNRTVQLQARMSLRRGNNWMVEGEAHHHGDPVRVELQVWDVVNETKMDHPFHLHGFFFQVLEVNGAPPEFMSWEDTINVPAQAASGSPGCPTTAQAAGCTTATSSSTTPRG